VFADLRSRLTWTRLLYILVELPLAVVYFSFLTTGVSTGGGLAITLIGLPVLVAVMFVWRWMAGGERRLAGSLLDEDIPPPYRALPAKGWWPRLRARIADPATWKDLVYLLLALPFSLATFVTTVTVLALALGLLTAPLWYWTIPDGIDFDILRADTFVDALALVPIGFALSLVSLRLVNWLGWAHGAFARVMLGRTSDPELEAQVVDLSTARARSIAAADAERRRLERDLHDGAQQRLVALTLMLELAKRKVAAGEEAEAGERLAEAEREARLAIEELRELARGIHPAILTSRGLDAGLAELAGRAAVPVTVEGQVGERLAPEIEAAAYSPCPRPWRTWASTRRPPARASSSSATAASST
jgi:hypothetical protein